MHDIRKNLLLIKVLSVSLIFLPICAKSAVFDDHVATQSFQTADGPVNSKPVPVKPALNKNVPAKNSQTINDADQQWSQVQQIVAHSKQIQSKNNALNDNVHANAEQPYVEPTTVSNQTGPMAQAKFNNQRYAQLELQMELLQDRVRELSQLVVMQNKMLQQVNGSNASSAVSAGFDTNWQRINQWLAPAANIIIYAMALMLLILIVVVFRTLPTKKAQIISHGSHKENDEDDTRSEYDFMNSREAIPAKLDLARAYIAMEDFPSAKEVLYQVKLTGNAEQKHQAQQLLDKCPNSP